MATALKVKCPVLKRGIHLMTSDFGKKRTYTNTNGQTVTDIHKGVDLISDGDGYDYIIALCAGKVIAAGHHSSMGNYVKVQPCSGVVVRYMHMKQGSVAVKTGDSVSRGQTIGYMGATGNVTGRHLHFDICINNTYVDPKPYLAGAKTIKASETGYTTGTYIVTGTVNVRKGAGTNYQRVYFSQFTANAQAQVKKLDPSCPDAFPAGIKISITNINGTWGKCPSGWLSLKYCRKV